jgi:Family of unknown function (DUF5327)
MQIGAEKLIQKMMSELQGALAQKGNEQKVREHMLIVRSLCDVMLDKEEGYTAPAPSYTPPSLMSNPIQVTQQPMQPLQQPIVMPSTTTEAKGDSLFDF